MVSISATDGAADETGPDTGQFTVSLDGGKIAPPGGIAVSYGIAGSALNTTDYGTLSGTVTIAAASGSATITVTPVNDTVVESSESVVLTVTGTNNVDVTAASSPNDIATVTIADNDSTTVSISATASSARFNLRRSAIFRWRAL